MPFLSLLKIIEIVSADVQVPAAVSAKAQGKLSQSYQWSVTAEFFEGVLEKESFSYTGVLDWAGHGVPVRTSDAYQDTLRILRFIKSWFTKYERAYVTWESSLPFELEQKRATFDKLFGRKLGTHTYGFDLLPPMFEHHPQYDRFNAPAFEIQCKHSCGWSLVVWPGLNGHRVKH